MSDAVRRSTDCGLEGRSVRNLLKEAMALLSQGQGREISLATAWTGFEVTLMASLMD